MRPYLPPICKYLTFIIVAEQDDMEEFIEHEEEFEARQSISSRGRDTRVQMMPNKGADNQKQQQPQQRQTQSQPQNQNLYNYNRPEEEAEGEESVITEIVDEQVVEIGSDEEEQQFENKGNEDGGINRYLDNIKQEDYVNRDEYQEFEDNKDENSPYRHEEMYEQDGRDEYGEEEGDMEYQMQDPNYGQEQNYQHMVYQNNMMENSPIAENPVEEELTGSPQYYEAPRAINPKIRRKYEGADLNDKSHLVWEQERLQRKRYEREMRMANMWSKPYNSREIDWNPSINPKKATFNFEKNPQRSNMWHFAQSSSVPMLSTASGVKANAAAKANRSKHDPAETLAKRNHNINNIFHQSSLQNMLTGGKKGGKIDAPSSHMSLKKENGRPFMTPAENKYQGYSDVVQGRAKNFYSSQIF